MPPWLLERDSDPDSVPPLAPLVCGSLFVADDVGVELRLGRGAISGSAPVPKPALDAIASCSAARDSMDPASNSEARFERMALRGAALAEVFPESDLSEASLPAPSLPVLLPALAFVARGALGAFASPSPPAAERIAATRSAFLRRVTPFKPIAPAMEWSSSRSLPSSIERSIPCFALNMGS
ncbi:unannotated protein [freshwater metagenome]|uniref:Unannotated protein n=1 Tax=freshwater metagenome TaxID=449393 RepID=A0A6J6X2R2_9ZZZZ